MHDLLGAYVTPQSIQVFLNLHSLQGLVATVMTKIIIGIGNTHRRDDGIGIEIVRRLRLKNLSFLKEWGLLTWQYDLFDLIPVVGGSSHVIIIDGLLDPLKTPGSFQQWDLARERPPEDVFPMSTHSLGLGSCLELMTAMGKIPPYFRLIGVVVADCGIGDGFSPLVTKSMDHLMHKVLRIVAHVGVGESVKVWFPHC